MSQALRTALHTLLAFGSLAACRRDEPAQATDAMARSDAAPAAAAPATPPPPAADSGGQVAAPAAVPDGVAPEGGAVGTGRDDGGAAAGSPLGAWMEGNIYRLKVEEVRRCRSSAAVGDAGAGGAAPILLGVRVAVTAKLDQLFVSPRDLTLESDGVIFSARLPTTAPPGCAPALTQRHLRLGQTASGIAVFELPGDFKPDARGPVLAFQPTRWGGAKRTEVHLPRCLADCEKAGARPAKGAAAGRASGR